MGLLDVRFFRGGGGGLFVFRRKWPHGLAIALIFGLGLFPVLGFVPFDFQLFSTVCDDYLYFSMFAVALGVALVFRRSQFAWQRNSWAALILILGMTTAFQLNAWSDSLSLFRRSLQTNPRSALCWTNLGASLFDKGSFVESADAYVRAVALNPKLLALRQALYTAYVMGGDRPRAEEVLRRWIEEDPGAAMPQAELGVSLLQSGRRDERFPFSAGGGSPPSMGRGSKAAGHGPHQSEAPHAHLGVRGQSGGDGRVGRAVSSSSMRADTSRSRGGFDGGRGARYFWRSYLFVLESGRRCLS